jgi:glycosyltransferase involved in cell wall biosynthesis
MSKLRIGYYMYTPMIGGAEEYLKDLLWLHDRERFEVTLFYESWPDFDQFLELDRCEGIHIRPVNVFEASGHTSVNWQSGSASEPPPDTNNGNAITPSRLKPKLKQISKHIPFAQTIASHGMRSLNFLSWSANRAKLKAALTEMPVDLLHIVNGGYPGATTGLIAALVAKELNIPCAMTISNTPGPATFPKSLERRIDKFVFQSVDKFIIISDLMGRQLVELRAFDPSKFYKIFWGVRAPELESSDNEKSRTYTRSQLGIPADATVIGSVSRFTSIKGQDHLVDAVSLLRPTLPNLRLVLVGDGPNLVKIKKRAVEKGVSDLTTFTGQYNNNEVFNALRAFDLFVHASELEGLPYCILEAMSQRKAVVATDVGGTSEAVISGETGLLVPPCDPVALAEAMGTIISDPLTSEQMAGRGYARFKHQFTIERMIQKHESLYQQLVEPQTV